MNGQILGFGREKRMSLAEITQIIYITKQLQKKRPVQGFFYSVWSKMKKISLVTKFRIFTILFYRCVFDKI